MIQFIFGIGTGRCGTGTLATFLNKQKGICCSHEGQFCPWERDEIAFYQSICGLLKGATEKKIGNVAFYWKNYLSEIFRDFNNPKVIVLKRKRAKVVESFSSMYKGKNHWSDPRSVNFDGKDPGVTPLGAMWPKYGLSKKKAIGKYWDEYYKDGAIDYYRQRFPNNIMVIRSEFLWRSEKAQDKILKFLDIPKEDRIYDTSIWEHKRRKTENLLEINKPFPKELNQIALNKALYGKEAMALAGMPIDVEMELSDAEMQQIMANKEVMHSLRKT